MEIGKNGLIESYAHPDERKAFLAGNRAGFRGDTTEYDGAWPDAYQYGYELGEAQKQELDNPGPSLP